MERELTPKQQTSESIRQAESILLLTSQNPTVDQVAGMVALSSVLKKFGKKVSAVISGDIPSNAKFLPIDGIESQLGGLRDFIVGVDLSHAEVDKVKYTIDDGKLNLFVTPFSGGFREQDVSYSYGDYHYDIVIVLGVSSFSKIDRIYHQNESLLEDIPLINIDFHRSNELYGAVNLVEPNAPGLGEILVALSESLQTGMIDSQIATTILAGIMASTDRFTSVNTTSKAMTVAAQMMASGADQKMVVKGLYSSKQPQRDQPQPQPQSQAAPQPASRQPSVQPAPLAQRPASPPVQPSQPSQPNQKQSQPKMQAEVYRNAGLELGGTIKERAVFVPAEPAEAQSIDASDIKTPNLETHSFETDGPAVTDPDESQQSIARPSVINLETAIRQAEPAIELPEPLINDESSSRPSESPQPSQAQPSQKRTNPTNNPIFANKLP